MAKVSNINHLLIVRLSAMGDVAMVVHAVRAIRVSYPDMRISILTRDIFEPLFEGLNVEFVPLDLKGRHKGVMGIKRLAKDISKLDVDIVADLHCVLRTSLLRNFLNLYNIPSARMHKGRVRKWMRMDGGCSEATIPLKHTVDRYCDVLRKIGLSFDPAVPAVKVARNNPMPYQKGSEKWVGIAPFSIHEGKCYPLHKIREVITQLSARYDRIFVHSGGGKELDFALEMEQTYPNVTALYSKITLGEERDLISHLDCLISMDSFAMHLASLVATPVVSIWGATHPSLGFSGFGSDPDGFVQIELPCRPCSTFGNKKCRFHDYHCLTEIEVSDIVERVALMIDKSNA